MRLRVFCVCAPVCRSRAEEQQQPAVPGTDTHIHIASPGFPALESLLCRKKEEKSGPERESVLQVRGFVCCVSTPRHFVLTRRFTRHQQLTSGCFKKWRGYTWICSYQFISSYLYIEETLQFRSFFLSSFGFFDTTGRFQESWADRPGSPTR